MVVAWEPVTGSLRERQRIDELGVDVRLALEVQPEVVAPGHAVPLQIDVDVRAGVMNGNGNFVSVSHRPVELDGEPSVSMREWKGLRRPIQNPVDGERLGVERASREPVSKRGHADRRLSAEGSVLFLEAQLDAVVQDVEVALALLAERTRVDGDLLTRERGQKQKELHSDTGARFWRIQGFAAFDDKYQSTHRRNLPRSHTANEIGASRSQSRSLCK